MSLWDFSYPTANGDDFSPPPREVPPAPSAALSQRRPAPIPSTSRINLEAWEKLCPLTDDERQSVASTLPLAADRPVPLHLRSGSSNRATSTPPLKVIAAEKVGQLDQTVVGQLGPVSSSVSTVQAFNDWFGIVADAIEVESEQRFRSYLEPVTVQLAVCEASLSELDDCRGLIREVEANWKFVDENAQSMERACEDMLQEQKHLDALASSTTERLDYFRRLEEAQRLLNLPGEAELVHRPEFLEMLDQLEVCLEFMKSNVCHIHPYVHTSEVSRLIAPLAAYLSRRRLVPRPLPTMPHPRHDPDQALLHEHLGESRARFRREGCGEGHL